MGLISRAVDLAGLSLSFKPLSLPSSVWYLCASYLTSLSISCEWGCEYLIIGSL